MAYLYLDEDVSVRIIPFCEQLGHSIAHARRLGFFGWPDSKHLLYAVSARRVMVTNNGTDYRLLHDAWHRWGAAWGVRPVHNGILILPHVEPGGFTYQDLANAIHDQVMGLPTLAGELHEWQPTSGWRFTDPSIDS